jgi:hypothetical protein
MKYILLIYSAEDDWTEESRTSCMIESMAVGRDLALQGKLVASAPLQFVVTARTVKHVDKKPIVTAGPFMETIEQLGGFYILDLTDLDEAIQVACRLPPVHKGTIEIRPIVEADDPEVGHCVSAIPESLDLTKSDSPLYMLLKYGGVEGVANGPLFKGQCLANLYLRSAELATSVRVRQGQRTIQDGVCDLASQQLQQILVVASSDELAVSKLAELMSLSQQGSWEIRPLFDLRPIVDRIESNSKI